MNPERDNNAGIDEWLRQSLPDDLPAEVAAGMRESIVHVRATQARAGARPAGWAWLRRRTVWAALSLLMLVAGIILQGAKASSPLADRISAIKTASMDSAGTRR